MSGLYKRFLLDRAPAIEITKSNTDDQEIFIRSKFFNNFQTLTEFTGYETAGLKTKDELNKEAALLLGIDPSEKTKIGRLARLIDPKKLSEKMGE